MAAIDKASSWVRACGEGQLSAILSDDSRNCENDRASAANDCPETVCDSAKSPATVAVLNIAKDLLVACIHQLLCLSVEVQTARCVLKTRLELKGTSIQGQDGDCAREVQQRLVKQ